MEPAPHHQPALLRHLYLNGLVPLVMLVILSGVVGAQVVRTKQQADWVAHSVEVAQELTQVSDVVHQMAIAERAFKREMGPVHDTATGLHALMTQVFRAASDEERLGVLNAHPDLAGKLAAARQLTDESEAEQASAGLDALTDAERAKFNALNTAYVEKHGFPFIIAVRDNTKPMILDAMHTRLGNPRETEFRIACGQVERIALLRLRAILPEL